MRVKNLLLIFILAMVYVNGATIFSTELVAETLFTVEKLDDGVRERVKKVVKESNTLDTTEVPTKVLDEVRISIPQNKPSIPQDERLSIRRNSYTAVQSFISKDTSTEITRILEKDHKDNVVDLVYYRWLFRKTANVAEAFGNGLLYLGTGLNAIAAAVTMVGTQQTANIILFTGTMCVAAHVALIGVAKCSAREQVEREGQLESLASAVGFKITSLKPEITDDEEDEENLANKKSKQDLRKKGALEDKA